MTPPTPDDQLLVLEDLRSAGGSERTDEEKLT